MRLANRTDNSNLTKSSKVCTDKHFCTVIPQAELVPEKPKSSALNQLTKLLLCKYNCGIRPVQNWTKPTTVYIDLIIQSVLDVVSTFQPSERLLVLVIFYTIYIEQFSCQAILYAMHRNVNRSCLQNKCIVQLLKCVNKVK